jgi:hypothetical protein
MILADAYLRKLLNEALDQIDTPPDCAALLEGSIAAGFGNSASDIDFLLVDDGDWEHLAMPTVLFIGGHRVEIRLRSLHQLRGQADDVFTMAARGPRHLAGIPEDLLNRCQRLSCAYPLANLQLAERAQELCGADSLVPIVTAWFAHRSRQSLRRAVAMSVLDESPGALRWARTGILQAAKSWLAKLGETYLERKWLALQMDRVAEDPGLRAEFWALLHRRDDDASAERYVRECVALAGRFGVDDCDYRPEMLSLSRSPSVSTWAIGERVHVVRGGDIFALDPTAARVWRSLSFQVPLPRVLTATERPGGLIAEYERLGLVSLAWRRGGVVDGPPPVTPPASSRWPIVCLDGGTCADDGVLDGPGSAISRLPLTAEQFANAGMTMVWANVMLENAREDLVGAIDAGQWGTAAAAAGRMLRQACLSLLCAYGFSPPPSAEDAASLASRLRPVPAEIRRRTAEVEDGLAVSDEASARRALDIVDDLRSRIRAVTGSAAFPSSFAAAADWQRTLELGYDWVRLGGYLNAGFPVDDARDLIASATTRSRPREQVGG